MGEMADFALDDVTEFENMRDLYHNGHLSSEDSMQFEDPTGAYNGFGGYSYDYAELNSYESLRDSIVSDINNFGSPESAGLIGFSSNHQCQARYHLMDEEEELRYFKDILLEKYSDSYTVKMIKQIKDSGLYNKKHDTKEKYYEHINSLKNNYSKAYEAISYILLKTCGSVLTGSGSANKEAVKRAERENPTCNICHSEMPSRHGKYGKFYFCENNCEGQGTVSDSYWQGFKAQARSI